MADKANVKVSIQLDEAEAAKLMANLGKISTEVDKVGKTNNQEAIAQQNNLSTAIKGSIEQYEYEDEVLNRLLATARALGKDEQFYAILAKKGYSEGIVAIQQMLGLKAKDNALTKEQIKLMNLRATELRHESIALRRGAMDLRLFSEGAFIAGTAGMASMILMAKQFSEAFKNGNADAARFTASMNALTLSKNKVGEAFSRALLPFIRDATAVLDRAGTFLNEHPEIATAAIKGAEILIAVGLVGKSIAFATRLTADFLAIQSSIMRLLVTRAEEALNADKALAAAETQKLAADEQLQAAGIQAEAAGAGNAGGAIKGAATIGGMSLGTAGMFVTLIAATVAGSYKLFKQLDELQQMLPDKFKFSIDVISKLISAVPGLQFVDMFKQLDIVMKRDLPLWQNLIAKILGVNNALSRTATTPAGRMDILSAEPGSVALSSNVEAMLDAYEKYLEDTRQLSIDHYAKMKEIAKDAQEAIEKENVKYAKAVEKINADLNKTLSRMAEDYANDVADAEAKYKEDRAKIVQDGNDDILRIEEDLKDKLAKLERESWFRQQDLIAARDALGLVKERRKLAEDELEAKLDASKDLARRREDTARRLAELDRDFALQKARRQQDYEQRVAEEQQQAKDKLAELAAEHDDELKQIREQAAAKAREEQIHYAEERKRLYDQFIKRLRDLDAFYLGETERERAHHAQLLADLDAFLAAYRLKAKAALDSIAGSTSTSTTTSTGGTTGSHTTGSHAYGGYAPYGNYILGDLPGGGKGPDEFVMSGATTRAAENIIGGKLTQQSLLAGMGKTIVWNDQRRFDSRLSLADRRQITNDTKQIIAEMLS